MNITPTNISTLNRSSVTVWNRGASLYTPISNRICAQVNTTTGSAVFGWLGAMPGMRPFVKEIEKVSLATNKWEVSTEQWGVGWDIPRLAILRDTFGEYAPMFEQNGLLSKVHPDKLMCDRLIAGMSAVDYTGSAFFATSGKKHATGVSKNSFGNKSTKQLTATYYGQAIAGLGKILSPDGTPFNLAQKYVLLVGEDNRSAAEDILTVKTLSGGGENKYYGSAELIVTPFITGSYWFLANVGMPMKPMVQVNEIPISFTAQTDPQSDSVFRLEAFSYKSYGVMTVNYGLPQLIWGSTGADA